MPKTRQSGLSDNTVQQDMFGGLPDSRLAPLPDPDVARDILTDLLKELKAVKRAPSGSGTWERMCLALYKQSLPGEEAARLEADIVRELTRLGIEKDRPRKPRSITQERYDELTVRSKTA